MQTHITPIIEIVKRYRADQRSVDVSRTVPYFEAALRHMAQHIDIVRSDKTRAGVVKAYEGQLQGIERVYKRMAGDLEQMRSQQQRQQAEQMQQQQAMQERMGAQALEITELRHKFALKEAAQSENLRLKQEKTDAGIDQKQQIVDADIANKLNAGRKPLAVSI